MVPSSLASGAVPISAVVVVATSGRAAMFRSCKQPPEDREVELCSTNKRKDSLKRDREEEDDEEEDEAVPLLGGAPKPARRWGSQGGAKQRQQSCSRET